MVNDSNAIREAALGSKAMNSIHAMSEMLDKSNAIREAALGSKAMNSIHAMSEMLDKSVGLSSSVVEQAMKSPKIWDAEFSDKKSMYFAPDLSVLSAHDKMIDVRKNQERLARLSSEETVNELRSLRKQLSESEASNANAAKKSQRTTTIFSVLGLVIGIIGTCLAFLALK